MTDLTDAQFEVYLDELRAEYTRSQGLKLLAFCTGCRAQFDSRRPCVRCTAFKQGRPWRHEELA